jgi:hypothetical protein
MHVYPTHVHVYMYATLAQHLQRIAQRPEDLAHAVPCFAGDELRLRVHIYIHL